MNGLELVVGLALLVWGRRLFWLFVAGIGFAAGLMLVQRIMPNMPETTLIVIALGIGLLGAVLAITIQRFTLRVAGFIAGGYITLRLLIAMGATPGPMELLYLLIGGIIGVVLLFALFDWALIILSALTGATLITLALPIPPPFTLLLMIVLVAVGVAAQARLLRGQASNSLSQT